MKQKSLSLSLLMVACLALLPTVYATDPATPVATNPAVAASPAITTPVPAPVSTDPAPVPTLPAGSATPSATVVPATTPVVVPVEMPAAPAVPAVPAIPAVPPPPAMPAVPSIPAVSVPTPPAVPAAPAVPTPPVVPAVPAVPTPPTIPAAPVNSAAPTPAGVATTGAVPSYEGHVKCEGGTCKIDTFLTKGFRTFSQCQVCHGIDGSGSTIAPNLMERLKVLDHATFVDRVTNGYTGQIGVMPPWKENPNVMNNLDSLYAYLKARSDNVLPAGKLEKF